MHIPLSLLYHPHNWWSYHNPQHKVVLIPRWQKIARHAWPDRTAGPSCPCQTNEVRWLCRISLSIESLMYPTECMLTYASTESKAARVEGVMQTHISFSNWQSVSEEYIISTFKHDTMTSHHIIGQVCTCKQPTNIILVGVSIYPNRESTCNLYKTNFLDLLTVRPVCR